MLVNVDEPSRYHKILVNCSLDLAVDGAEGLPAT